MPTKTKAIAKKSSAGNKTKAADSKPKSREIAGEDFVKQLRNYPALLERRCLGSLIRRLAHLFGRALERIEAFELTANVNLHANAKKT